MASMNNGELSALDQQMLWAGSLRLQSYLGERTVTSDLQSQNSSRATYVEKRISITRLKTIDPKGYVLFFRSAECWNSSFSPHEASRILFKIELLERYVVLEFLS